MDIWRIKKEKKIIKRKKNIISLNCILRFKKFEKLGITWVKQKRKFKKKKTKQKINYNFFLWIIKNINVKMIDRLWKTIFTIFIINFYLYFSFIYYMHFIQLVDNKNNWKFVVSDKWSNELIKNKNRLT